MHNNHSLFYCNHILWLLIIDDESLGIPGVNHRHILDNTILLWEFHPVAHNPCETIASHIQYCDIKPFILYLHPYRNTTPRFPLIHQSLYDGLLQ